MNDKKIKKAIAKIDKIKAPDELIFILDTNWPIIITGTAYTKNTKPEDISH